MILKELIPYIHSNLNLPDFLRGSRLRFTLVRNPGKFAYPQAIKKIVQTIPKFSLESDSRLQELLFQATYKIWQEIDSQVDNIEKKVKSYSLCHELFSFCKKSSAVFLVKLENDENIILKGSAVSLLNTISPYFQKIIKEKLSNGKNEMEFVHFSKKSFITLLKHLFETKPSFDAGIEIVELIQLSDYLGINYLRDYYLSWIENQMYQFQAYSLEELTDLFLYGCQTNNEKIMLICLDWIVITSTLRLDESRECHERIRKKLTDLEADYKHPYREIYNLFLEGFTTQNLTDMVAKIQELDKHCNVQNPTILKDYLILISSGIMGLEKKTQLSKENLDYLISICRRSYNANSFTFKFQNFYEYNFYWPKPIQALIKKHPNWTLLHYANAKKNELSTIPGIHEAYQRAITLNPQFQQAYIEQARVYESNKELDQAVKVLKDGMQKCGYRAGLLTAMTNLYRNMGKLDNALAFLDEVLKADPLNKEALRVWLGISKDKFKYERDLELLKQFLTNFPHEAELYDKLIQVYQSLHRFEDAIKLCKDCIQRFPAKEITYLFKISEIYMDIDEYSRAYQILTQILAIDPNNYKARSERGLVLSYLDQPQEAIEEAKKAINEKEDYRISLAETYFRNGQFEISYKILKSIPEINRNRIWLSCKVICLLGLNESDKGIKILLDPSSRLFKIDRLVWLSFIYTGEGQFEQAMEQIHQLKNFSDFHYNLYSAELFFHQYDFDMAYEYAIEAMSLKPYEIDAIAYKGLALLKRGMKEEAVACYQEGLAKAPGGASIKLLGAEIHFSNGDLLTAMKEINTYLMRYPFVKYALNLKDEIEQAIKFIG